MDSGKCSVYSNGNVVYIVPGNDGNNNERGLGSIDQTIWATEEGYGIWNTDASVNADSNFDGRQIHTGSGSEPPYKKARISQPGDSQPTNQSKVMAKMFPKTKLCYKFRDGSCPYITNCNFAHGIEELRRLPPNWQELIASYEEEQAATELKEFQIPSQIFKGRHCKKFLSKEGCPYGDHCFNLHDEQERDRKSVAIILGSGSRDKYGAASAVKPVNWKTKICKTWEQTGQCSYGDKCNFAHGTAELQRYGAGLAESEGKKSAGDTIVASAPLVPFVENYHRGVPSQRVPKVHMAEQISHQKSKRSDKISLIYGDWIDDLV